VRQSRKREKRPLHRGDVGGLQKKKKPSAVVESKGGDPPTTGLEDLPRAREELVTKRREEKKKTCGRRGPKRAKKGTKRERHAGRKTGAAGQGKPEYNADNRKRGPRARRVESLGGIEKTEGRKKR